MFASLAASLTWPDTARADRAADTTAPPRRRRTGPLFIHDAVIPLRGETLLLQELRRAAQERDDQP